MNNKIAFFDSGQGGLTLWESVIKAFPDINTIYLGDNARYPYGNKSGETIVQYTSSALFWLARQRAAIIIVACGTASSVAVEPIKPIFNIPIIGIVEGFSKKAQQLLTNKESTIAVLGTRFTVKSGTIMNELKKHGVRNIWQKACPLFVPLVEEGVQVGEITNSTADLYLHDLPSSTEVVMLACTHFPRLAQSIANSIHKKTNRTIINISSEGEHILKMGGHNQKPIYLIDSSVSIVEIIKDFITAHKAAQNFFLKENNFYCTDSPERFEEVAKIFTSETINNIEKIHLG